MADQITVNDIDILDIDPPITAYVSRSDRRRLLVAMDVMRRYVTKDGAIFDSKYPWIKFMVLEDHPAYGCEPA